MQDQYNQSDFASSPQNRSQGRGRGQGYLWGITQFGQYQQRNQNKKCMHYMDYRTQTPYQHQMSAYSWQSNWNQDCVNNMPHQMSATTQKRHHVSDKVQNPRQSHENWRRMDQQDIVRLSKTLTFLLRHGAENLGFHFMPGGFLYVEQLLKYHKPLKGFTLMQIKELVRTNDKQQFALQEDDVGRLMIRANQGHTTAGQQDIVRLSKTLAFLLRHGAENLGFHFMPGGFLYVEQLLKYHKPLKGFTLMQIKELVRTNDKQLFALKKDDVGRLMIRANQGHTTAGQQDIVRLSKTLAFLLRHGAENLGFHFMPGGFLYVEQLLKYHKPLKGFTVMQIKELVRTNDKQLFALKKDDVGRLMIRANQGHTTAGQQDIVRLSKTLAFLLRHGAEKLGVHFMPGGFLYVEQLLKYHKPLKGFTVMQIKELVRTNDKQQFALQVDDVGRLMIRANQGHTTAGQQDIVRLSKTLAFLLRHGAENLGFHFMPGGFLYVDQLLKYHKPLKGFTLKQIEELVRTNDKQLFALKKDDVGRLMIRANQGHTTAVEGLDLSPIYDSSEVQTVVHGTYYQAWDQIQNTGLSRMNRNHIHFAAGMPGESGVISGMRKSCEVVIEIDLEKALKARIPFFRSANNVILSPGNEKGFIPPTFFKRVFDRHSGEELMPLDFLSVQVAAERSSQQCPTKRVREGQSEDEYPCKKRREDRSSSQKARFKKEGSTSQSGTLKYKKDDGKFGKLQNEKDKEETKQMRSKDEKGDRKIQIR